MKKLFVLLFVSLFVLLALPLAISADSGKAIGTADELVAIMSDSTKWNGNYYLTADIDLTGKTQNPIGNLDTKFTGTFDGKGKTISGLDISGENYLGLFGYATDATIKNLNIKGKVNSTATTGTDIYVAALCGALGGNSTVENITVEADVSANMSASAQSVAGLIGKVGISKDNATITINNCQTKGNFSAARGVSGLIGVVSMGGVDTKDYTTVFSGGKINITDCTTDGKVTYNSTSNYAQSGGMIGNLLTNLGQGFEINLKNCTNKAAVSGEKLKARVGGVVGWVTCDKSTSVNNSSGGKINLSNCVNAGRIAGTGDVGGVVGYVTLQYRTDYILNMHNCVNTGIVTASNTGAGGVLGTNKGGIFILTECANYGSVSADSQKAGGVMGYSETASSTAVLSANFTDCANYGTVTSFTTVAGIIASGNSNVTMTRCFNGGKLVCIDLTGTKAALGASLTGEADVKDSYFISDNMDLYGQSVSKADAAKPATFTGWDFTNVWEIENDKPSLKNLTAKGPAQSDEDVNGSNNNGGSADTDDSQGGSDTTETTDAPNSNVGGNKPSTDSSKDEQSTTAAPTTNPAPQTNSEDMPIWLIAMIAVAAVGAVAIVVLLIKIKK